MGASRARDRRRTPPPRGRRPWTGSRPGGVTWSTASSSGWARRRWRWAGAGLPARGSPGHAAAAGARGEPGPGVGHARLRRRADRPDLSGGTPGGGGPLALRRSGRARAEPAGEQPGLAFLLWAAERAHDWGLLRASDGEPESRRGLPAPWWSVYLAPLLRWPPGARPRSAQRSRLRLCDPPGLRAAPCLINRSPASLTPACTSTNAWPTSTWPSSTSAARSSASASSSRSFERVSYCGISGLVGSARPG